MLCNVDEKGGIKEVDEEKREVHSGRNHRDLRKEVQLDRDRERRRKAENCQEALVNRGIDPEARQIYK